VFFAELFMWRFNNERETARNPDQGVFIPLQEKMLHRWMQQENTGKLPAAFGDYLKFISQVLEDNQKKGGIAMKFEVAYFRPTTSANPSVHKSQEFIQPLAPVEVPLEINSQKSRTSIFAFLLAKVAPFICRG